MLNPDRKITVRVNTNVSENSASHSEQERFLESERIILVVTNPVLCPLQSPPRANLESRMEPEYMFKTTSALTTDEWNRVVVTVDFTDESRTSVFFNGVSVGEKKFGKDSQSISETWRRSLKMT